MRAQAVLAVAAFVVTSVGCFQPHRKLVLPPRAPVVAKEIPQPQIEVPPRMEAQIPPIDLERIPRPSYPPIQPPPAQPAPAGGRVLPRRPGGNPATTPPVPEVETPVTPTPAPATPQLSEILTEDRRRQYETEFAGYVGRAKEVLNRASRGRLNIRQQQTTMRIQTFLQQAEESKVKDVVTAVELARRADLLAQDLLKSLR
jgi:hypothetical protein